MINAVRKSLFSSTTNTLLTVLSVYLLWVFALPVIEWAFLDATWIGESKSDCSASDGACWAFIGIRLDQFLYGLYPSEETWRINLAFGILLVLFFGFFIRSLSKLWVAVLILLPYPIIAGYLFYGGVWGLQVVETFQWGGLFLTVILAGVGIVIAFPVGILLALGRRSEMPVIRALCVGFIEIVRGVPLISVFFMASVMLPLFLPEGVNFDKLVRALVGISLFQSAYMAEVVRGGLQAIPQGQIEAAESLGLGYWRMMFLIILPQALKMVIPGLMNISLELFKDTTLVIIIGLFDFLGIMQASLTDPDWLGMAIEGYVFCAVVYWMIGFSISRYSYRVERKLDAK